jgi:hypothetical protein
VSCSWYSIPSSSKGGDDARFLPAGTPESLVVRADGPFEGSGELSRVRFLGGRTCFGPIAGAIPIRSCL